ncbi:MAG: DUF393 domain-containing protein [Gammaproteobacteria bacterium]|nr:DUF393 domain-containing protein [Gammaproteobacteria bacterium]
MKPRLVYDGDCAFCRYMVAYAASVTGDAVEYRPYQEVRAEYADIGEKEFAETIWLFSGTKRYRGADAAFRTLAEGGAGLWQALYRRLPGFALLAEAAYRWTARRRSFCLAVCRILFGGRLVRAEFAVTADVLVRGIALCGLAAFVSLWWQIDGLGGPGGVLPAEGYLEAVRDARGAERYWLLPTVFWVDASGLALHVVCAVGTAATLVALAGRWRCVAALVAYTCYLSLLGVGQVFLSYQWDILLIECFVVAAVLARAPAAGVWLTRLVLFRFMFLSGFVKLASADPTWADGTALGYHFETQPLPTALAWYAHHAPAVLLEWGVKATLFIELVLPFCVVLPRNPRLVAAAAFVLLELLIFATGNYNFFNVLTVVLCVALLDDRLLPAWFRGVRPVGGRTAAKVAAGCVMVLGIAVTVESVARQPWFGSGLTQIVRPLRLANPYGLFAVMTTERDELVVEGSLDGETWTAYGFPFKPGDPSVAPRWAAPHQPRLDWQMWFAALTTPERAPWTYDLAFALLEARPAVLGLLADPFDGARPTYLRILRYPYRFTTPEEKSRSGDWWARGPATVWMPPIRLRRPVVTHEPLTLD